MKTIENFWNWFKRNNSKYFYLNQLPDNDKKEELLTELLEQLHKYCDKLYFEIGGMPDEPQELIITAEGNIDYFDKVNELVSHAPKINDWNFIAFKPPMGTDFSTTYEDIIFDPKRLWFLPLENENDISELGLRIYFPDYDLQKEEIYLEGCYKVLDPILGEVSVATDIQHIEVDKLPKKPEDEGLIELTELPQYITWRKEKNESKS